MTTPPKPTTAEERADLGNRHREKVNIKFSGGYKHTGKCQACNRPWPCPTNRLLADLERAEADLARARERIGELEAAGRGAIAGFRFNYDQERDNGEWFATEPPEFAKDPWNNDDAFRCGDCGAWMTCVRPGKVQCDYCGSDPRAALAKLLEGASP